MLVWHVCLNVCIGCENVRVSRTESLNTGDFAGGVRRAGEEDPRPCCGLQRS
jgi:hypothetical protein